MTQADEIVRARLTAERESREAREEQARRDEVEAGTRYLIDAIPRLLARLEELDYPDAKLLNVSGPSGPRVFGRRRQQFVDVAGWLLDEDKWSEGHSSVYLLSDGRLTASGWSSQSSWSSRPIEAREIPVEYGEEGAINLLGRASKGVRELSVRYGAARGPS